MAETAAAPMVKMLAVVAIMAASAGCNRPAQGVEQHDISTLSAMRVWHDDERSVTCWVASRAEGIAVACIPDVEFSKGKVATNE